MGGCSSSGGETEEVLSVLPEIRYRSLSPASQKKPFVMRDTFKWNKLRCPVGGGVAPQTGATLCVTPAPRDPNVQ